MFSTAEWFLLAWAMFATACAGYYQHQVLRWKKAGEIQQRVLIGLMLGTAIMRHTQNGAVFTNSNEGEDDEIRIESRQSEGSDSP